MTPRSDFGRLRRHLPRAEVELTWHRPDRDRRLHLLQRQREFRPAGRGLRAVCGSVGRKAGDRESEIGDAVRRRAEVRRQERRNIRLGGRLPVDEDALIKPWSSLIEIVGVERETTGILAWILAWLLARIGRNSNTVRQGRLSADKGELAGPVRRVQLTGCDQRGGDGQPGGFKVSWEATAPTAGEGGQQGKVTRGGGRITKGTSTQKPAATAGSQTNRDQTKRPHNPQTKRPALPKVEE